MIGEGKLEENIIKLSNIYKEYIIGKKRLEVLKGINFSIKRKEKIAIIGSSGVGKSTLLNIIGTLDKPTKGELLIDNCDVSKLKDTELASLRNSKIGFVFQLHHLLPEFTALENIGMPGYIMGRDKNEVDEKALQLLKEVGLEERISHKPGELSGGELQRVAVARSLINDPIIVLADEPTGNLDRKNGEALLDLIWRLSEKKNQTFLIVTHNEKIAGEADRIIELYDGKIKN